MTSTPDTLIAVVAALLAGLCLANTGVVQQRAASARPKGDQFTLRLVLSLARDRLWLLGIGTAVASYAFQAVALHFGPLSLVQPLIVSELLFAVPVSARREGHKIDAREWTAMGMIVAGLAVGMVAASPHGGSPHQPITSWAFALGAVTLIAALAVAFGRGRSGAASASLYALAGSLVLALQSGIYQATIRMLVREGAGVFATWYPYVLVIASLTGMFLVQNAYQAGPLSASMPVMDAVLPTAAIAIGIGLFNEQIRTTLPGLIGAAAGLVLLVVGIVALETRVGRTATPQPARPSVEG